MANVERILFLPAIVLLAAGVTAPAEDSKAEPHAPVYVELDLESPTALKPAEVRFSALPGGRACGFVCFGPSKPETIRALTDLGFRVSIYLDPKTEAARVKELKAARADIGVDPWNTRGGYGSIIEHMTLQETFDAVVTSRLVLGAKAGAPVLISSFGGHYKIASFPIGRNPDVGPGYGCTFEDANYRALFDTAHPFMVYQGFGRPERLRLRSITNAKAAQTRNIPSERIYYDMLATQFEAGLLPEAKGKVIRFQVRDFQPKDMKELVSIIGPFGKHKDLWHCGDGEAVAYDYLKDCLRVDEVRGGEGGKVTIVLGLTEEAFPDHFLAPLSLHLPATCKVKTARIGAAEGTISARDEGVHIEFPLSKALGEGCRMSLALSRPDLTVPDTMKATLTIANELGQPIENARLRWSGSRGMDDSPGLTVRGGDGEAFSLPAGGKKEIEVELATAKGARFGLQPVRAILSADCGGRPHTFLAGWEIPVAPLLGVAIYPMNPIALPANEEQWVEVELDNTQGEHRFLSHRAGACKGRIAFELAEGLEAHPAETPFELGENERKSFLVRITNSTWSDAPGRIRPFLKLDGMEGEVSAACPGVAVVRDRAKLEYKPLDESGLLFHANFDDPTRAVGNASTGQADVGEIEDFASKKGQSLAPIVTMPNGAKGKAAISASWGNYDHYRNVDHRQGTALFWMRRDPTVRNELRDKGDPKETWKQRLTKLGGKGEGMVYFHSPQRNDARGGSGLMIRRFPTWDGKEGYLELVYQCLGLRMKHLHVPYEKARENEWRHVAMLWSLKEKRLELYLDGKLAAKAEPGDEPWYGVPWDAGKPHTGTGGGFVLITCDHGHWSGTARDEFFIYNRPLTPEEIEANMKLVKK